MRENVLNRFIFATGIECSYPTVQHGKRRDELESTCHYQNWQTDLELCKEVGAHYVRYGIPYYRVHKGPQQYDWSFCDQVLPVMRQLGLTPILDLCHFGVPDWVGNFQNPDWPDLFAEFAAAFADRYPWIRCYTPVNEILVCARLSARIGIWNEQLKSDRAMITALCNLCRAQILAARHITMRVPEAVFFQNEVAEVMLERWPETHNAVEFCNQERFLSFDLIYGHDPGAAVLMFLLDNGMNRETIQWFMRHGEEARHRCIMGLDYYTSNERTVCPDGTKRSVGTTLGWAAIAEEYFQRYHKPIMLTETNCLHVGVENGPDWLWTMWHNVQHLRRRGVPVVGLTWYSLQDQIDWDIQLKEIRSHVNRNGLYNLDRHPNPVASAFRDLYMRYRDQPIVSDFAMGGICSPNADDSPTRHPAVSPVQEES